MDAVETAVELCKLEKCRAHNKHNEYCVYPPSIAKKLQQCFESLMGDIDDATMMPSQLTDMKSFVIYHYNPKRCTHIQQMVLASHFDAEILRTIVMKLMELNVKCYGKLIDFHERQRRNERCQDLLTA